MARRARPEIITASRTRWDHAELGDALGFVLAVCALDRADKITLRRNEKHPEAVDLASLKLGPNAGDVAPDTEETEARAPELGSQGLGFGGGGAGLGFGGGGLGFAPASGGDGEDDGPAAGGLNPMDVDDNDSDDEDLLPSTFGQRYARSIARDGPRNQKLFPPLSADRHGRTDTPRAAEPWPLRSRILSCDNVNHACSRTSPATRQVQCAPTGYRAARHLFVGCSVCSIFCLSRLIRRP